MTYRAVKRRNDCSLTLKSVSLDFFKEKIKNNKHHLSNLNPHSPLKFHKCLKTQLKKKKSKSNFKTKNNEGTINFISKASLEFSND